MTVVKYFVFYGLSEEHQHNINRMNLCGNICSLVSGSDTSPCCRDEEMGI